jgi:putative ABC transport system permease protein
VSLLGLVLKEIARRKAGFALACLAVTVAAAGVVYTETLSGAFEDALRRITKDMDRNISVVPAGADAAAFWAGESGTQLMDESLVAKIAATEVPAEHYLGKIQLRLSAEEGGPAILTGITGDVGAVGRGKGLKKAPMGFEVARGQCVLGAAVAERLGEKVRPGAKLSLKGREFTVTAVPGKAGAKPGAAVASRGPIDDLRIFVNIADAQELLGASGKIHAIDALGCVCPIGGSANYLTEIERQIEKTLPGTKASTYANIARARLLARQGAERTGQLTVGALAVLALLVIFFYLYSDVRERREELGMFLAVGFSPGRLAVMYLAKVVLIALVGAALGFAAGSVGAMEIDSAKLGMVGIKPQVNWLTAAWAVGGALVISVLASVLPVLSAARTDPADVLRKT